MNFVFLSPHFPSHYVNFADRLKKMGVNVLGIAEAPYDSLTPQMKNSLTEYYRVENMNNYDEMVRAIGYFIHKYGRIDKLESFNEHWLELDAKLRTDFNIVGTKYPDVMDTKRKYLMKKYFEKAKVPSARCHIVTTLEEGKKFVKEVGYPVIVKPDVGVGAYATYPIKNEEELETFYRNYPPVQYVMEEFVNGMIVTFDGITDQNNNIIFVTSHSFPVPVMDTVNESRHLFYHSNRDIDKKLYDAGERIVKAFDTSARFFHFEFFKLAEDKKGLGKKGDYVALEVNMRPPGGIMPELMNYECDTDVYQIYADMVVHNKHFFDVENKFYGMYASRKNEKNYKNSHDDIMNRYGFNVMHHAVVDPIFAAVMGDYVYLMRAHSRELMDEIIDFVHGTY